MTGLLEDTAPMAVYTVLSDDFVRAMVAVHPAVNGPPPGHVVVEIMGMPQGSINTTYRVRMDTGATWYLRVNEGKPFERLLRERDLLAALQRAPLGGVVTPTMTPSVAGSVFFAVDVDDGVRRWASLFEGLPGREIGAFEVEAGHARQVGAFLARAHLALRRFRGGPNPYGHAVVRRWLPALLAFEGTRSSALRVQSTLDDVLARRRPLPRGLIHGDLFVDNSRWESSSLVAVFDWEMAGRDALVLDLAITLCAWCFRREDGVMRLRHDVAAALVEGYQQVRRLRPSELRGLLGELRLAAIRFAASRMKDFSLPRPEGSVAERRFLDPADFFERLDLIEGLGDRGVRQALGLAGRP